ncbi:Hypothetical predicted protein [Lecanosticta acicola]|uniref:Uncharacterized protein n=1 Tax=Lecanosticta acicola TaxID=111012 RepID=A0AAI8YY59_9PEZI|nr:Hypothetical predicted protein [Lecanosticta acicola]
MSQQTNSTTNSKPNGYAQQTRMLAPSAKQLPASSTAQSSKRKASSAVEGHTEMLPSKKQRTESPMKDDKPEPKCKGAETSTTSTAAAVHTARAAASKSKSAKPAASTTKQAKRKADSEEAATSKKQKQEGGTAHAISVANGKASTDEDAELASKTVDTSQRKKKIPRKGFRATPMLQIPTPSHSSEDGKSTPLSPSSTGTSTASKPVLADNPAQGNKNSASMADNTSKNITGNKRKRSVIRDDEDEEEPEPSKARRRLMPSQDDEEGENDSTPQLLPPSTRGSTDTAQPQFSKFRSSTSTDPHDPRDVYLKIAKNKFVGQPDRQDMYDLVCLGKLEVLLKSQLSAWLALNTPGADKLGVNATVVEMRATVREYCSKYPLPVQKPKAMAMPDHIKTRDLRVLGSFKKFKRARTPPTAQPAPQATAQQPSRRSQAPTTGSSRAPAASRRIANTGPPHAGSTLQPGSGFRYGGSA